MNGENEKKLETQEDREGDRQKTMFSTISLLLLKHFFVLKAIAWFLLVFTLYFLLKILFIYRHVFSFSFFSSVWKKAMNHVEFFSPTAEKSVRKKSYQQIAHIDERKEKSFI